MKFRILIIYILLGIFSSLGIILTFKMIYDFHARSIIKRNEAYTQRIINDKDEALHVLNLLSADKYDFHLFVGWMLRNNPEVIRQSTNDSVQISNYKIDEVETGSYYDKCLNFALDAGIFEILKKATYMEKQSYSGFLSNGGISLQYADFFKHFMSLRTIVTYQVLRLLDEGKENEAVDILVYWGNSILIIYPQYKELIRFIEHVKSNYKLSSENSLLLDELLSKASISRNTDQQVNIVIPKRQKQCYKNVYWHRLYWGCA